MHINIVDHNLSLTKYYRKSIANFRRCNYILYNMNYSQRIRLYQSKWYWNEIPLFMKKDLIRLGYNKEIWESYSSPIKYVVPRMITLCRDKIYEYYFEIMVSKCLLKRERYQNRFEWVRLKCLYDQGRAVIRDDKSVIFRNVMELPKDLVDIIINRM